MFDLEKSIADWRKRMRGAGVTSPVLLDELESHLREDISLLSAAGKDTEAAFNAAAARIGHPATLGTEFNKSKRWVSPPTLVGSGLWLAAMAVLLVFLSAPARWYGGKLNFLLLSHVFSLTAGYFAVFTAGALSIYAIAWRRVVPETAAQGNELNHAIRRFTQISAGLVSVGIILGMFWSSQHRGHFFGGDPREMATLCAALWLGASAWIQRSGHSQSARVALRPAQLGIIGNMIAALAWFGAGAIVQGYGITSQWPLDAFLGAHLFFLGMTVTPRRKPGRIIAT